MSAVFRRTEPKAKDNFTAGLVAGTLAAGVAAVSFYFVRLFLAREEIPPLPPRSGGEAPDSGEERD